MSPGYRHPGGVDVGPDDARRERHRFTHGDEAPFLTTSFGLECGSMV
jgi:hypothetical protein